MGWQPKPRGRHLHFKPAVPLVKGEKAEAPQDSARQHA